MLDVRPRGASDDVSSIAASQALAALAVLLLVAAASAWWIGRRHRRIERTSMAWFVGGATVALILAVTLFRDGAPTAFDLGAITDWSDDSVRLLRRDPLGSSQFLLNVALFVPAGLAWSWIARRPARVAIALAAGSLAIEAAQAVTGAGAADLADLVANSVGGAIGATTYALLHRRPMSDRWATPRHRAIATGVATSIVLATTAAWFVGASRHQQRTEDALRTAFNGTDRAAIEARLASDPSSVFGAVTDFADGTRHRDEALEIRYPADFFGLHRCVFVVWSDDDVEFRPASGDSCTEFIDG